MLRCVALRGAPEKFTPKAITLDPGGSTLAPNYDFRSILRPRGVQNGANMAPKWLPGDLWAALGAPTLIFELFGLVWVPILAPKSVQNEAEVWSKFEHRF